MKVVLMFKRIDKYGAPKIMAWLSNQLTKQGYEVTLLAFYSGFCEQPLSPEVKFHSLNIKVSRYWIVRNTVDMVVAMVRLENFLSRERPDLVITFQDSFGQIFLLINRLYRRWKVITSERADPFSYNGIRGKIRHTMMNLADGVVFQTEGARSYYKLNNHIFNSSVVIPNPVIVPSAVGKLLEEVKVNYIDRDNRIVTVGRLENHQKRYDILLKAFFVVRERHPEVTLHFYGDGSDRECLQEVVEELGLTDSVFFEGQSSDIIENIMRAKVFAMSSDFEGIPNALIEAMVAGVPCVSTNCSPGGAELLIRNGENGYVVPRGDARALAEKIINLIEDEKISNRFSQESPKIRHTFSEEKIMQLWDNYIQSEIKVI